MPLASSRAVGNSAFARDSWITGDSHSHFKAPKI